MPVQGLGEIYEEDFMQATAAVTGTALDDKEEKIRAEARMLTRELFAKLDALSHFQYAPKPVIEDLSVKANVPALAMEEVAPQVGQLRQSRIINMKVADGLQCALCGLDCYKSFLEMILLRWS